MKHGQLVPSLHAQKLNPQIDFPATPFVLQQELTEWKRPVILIDGQMKECPRVAGISSFGAGGANAHIIIEEYISQEPHAPSTLVTKQKPALIVLSAKDEVRLREQVEQLLKAVEAQTWTDEDLLNMAYTLQVGREAMEERVGIVATSLKELEEKLQAFLEGRLDTENLYQGQVKRNREVLSIIAIDEDMEKTIESWITKGKYTSLLDLWVKGLTFNWTKLYDQYKPKRISLPTYPFAKERYWMTKYNSQQTVATASQLPSVQFNELFYDGLFNGLLDNSLSIEAAINKIGNFYNN
jgi:acyl transferase domain-containing protein